MNREEAKERAEIMIAYANGAKIEFFSRLHNGWTEVLGEPTFDVSDTYRIKPEPKKRLMTREEAIYLYLSSRKRSDLQSLR